MLLKDKIVVVSGIGPGLGVKLAIEAAREGGLSARFCTWLQTHPVIEDNETAMTFGDWVDQETARGLTALDILQRLGISRVDDEAVAMVRAQIAHFQEFKQAVLDLAADVKLDPKIVEAQRREAEARRLHTSPKGRSTIGASARRQL